MISNKEKRFSHASTDLNGPLGNNINNLHPSNFGLVGKSQHHNNYLNAKDAHLKKLINDRNSHSLNHDFSQLYISNLKGQIGQSFTHGKPSGNEQGSRFEQQQHALFEEMTAYKKDALESKKQMHQMQKSIVFWNDCTEYWRNKWRKTRDDKKKLNDEVKQLKTRLNRLEHQLQVSEEKRLRVNDEVNFLNEEISRYMCRFEEEGTDFSSKSKHLQASSSYFNSDRRVDYRKKHRRKKDLFLETKQLGDGHQSSSSGEDDRNHNPQVYSSLLTHNEIRKLRQSNETAAGSLTSSKNIFRQHERLFDKKIMNRKRFSQVVMLDEDEIFQMNQEIPANSTLRNNDDTLKGSINKSLSNDYFTVNTNSTRPRFIDFVHEEASGEEEDGYIDRIKPGQFFNDDLQSTPLHASSGNNINNSVISTIESSSQSANIESSSLNNDQLQNQELKEHTTCEKDKDLLKSDPQIERHKFENFEDGINHDDEDDDEV